jgi:hypothetical protein
MEGNTETGMRQAQNASRSSYWELAARAIGILPKRSVLAAQDRVGDELVPNWEQVEQGPHERALRGARIREGIGETVMDHRDVLKEAQSLLSQRGTNYGEAQENFERAATLLSILSGKHMTAYDIALAMLSVKLSRIAHRRDHHDSWVDGINYMAFCAEFTGKDAPDAVLNLALKKVQSNLNEAIRGDGNGGSKT